MGFVKKSDVITTVDKLTPVSDSVGIIITKADGTTPSMTLNTEAEKIESESGAPSAELALDGLTDVDVATATDGQALVFDAVSGKWLAETVETAVALAELTDVTIGTPQNGNALIYNSTTSKWTPNSVSSLVKSMPNTIVDITSSQTWTVPAGIGRVKIVAVGGGGNGGSGSSNTSYSGGGGGGMSIKIIDVNPTESIGITISSGNATVTHSPTSTTMTANKGGGGSTMTNGGLGGTASGGSINISGGDGAAGNSGLCGGSGGAIGGNHGPVMRYLNDTQTKVLFQGASFFSGSSKSFRTIQISHYYVSTAITGSFMNFLLYGFTQLKTSTGLSLNGDERINGIDGFFGAICDTTGSDSQEGANGNETGSGTGGSFWGTGGSYNGGNGGTIGAGGGGAAVNTSSYRSGGTGGAAHVYIIY